MMPGPSPSPGVADQPAATTRHVVSPLASTHEAPSLRDSGEQDQRQENEPHVQTATADAHGLYKSHLSLSQQLHIGHKVRPAIAKDFPKRPGTEGVKSSSQIICQSPSLTSVEKDWKHQGPEDSDFRPLD